MNKAALHGSLQTVLVVDDDKYSREVLRRKLGFWGVTDIHVAYDGRDGLNVMEAMVRDPDFLICDIFMPDMDGIAATRQVKQIAPRTSVIMLTMYENPDYLFEAVKAGASGYVLKDVAGVDLLEAIHTVAGGGSLLNQEVVGRFLRRLAAEVDQRSSEPAASPGPDRLTPRELDVLRLIAAGMSNKEIAVRLSVTVATVKTHLEHILQKLQVSDRTQAAVYAVTHGLLA